MRRLALVLLTCLGLTLAIAGSAGAAKPQPQPLPELQFVGDPQAAPVIPDPFFAGQCNITLTWDAAPSAPKGYTLSTYFVTWTTATDGRTLNYSGTTGFIRVPNGTTDVNIDVWAVYDKTKGKFAQVGTPLGAADGPYTWTC